MRYTTLQLVNKVLNGLDLDAVSTLGETEDSEQVLEIIDRVITEIDLDLNWVPRRDTVRLSTSTGSAYDTTTGDWEISYPAIPWAMALPTGVEAVYKVYYNDKLLTYVPPEEFLDKIVKGIYFKTTAMPRYWTSSLIGQGYIVFDSFLSTTESYLSAARSLAYVTKYPQTVYDTDGETIDLSDKFYTAVLLKALMYGFYELNKNISLGREYKELALVAKSKLLEQADKLKGKDAVHPGERIFPRQTGRGLYIDETMYREL